MTKKRKNRDVDMDKPIIPSPQLKNLFAELEEARAAGRQGRPGISDEIAKAIKRCRRVNPTNG